MKIASRMARLMGRSQSAGETRVVPSQSIHGGRYGVHTRSTLMGGGMVNYSSGAGVQGLDKSEGSFFTPTRIFSRSPLEILCVQSWAAANFVDLPLEDMFIRWRKFEHKDNSVVRNLEEAEMDLEVEEGLLQAMRSGRQYGTGILVIITGEDSLEKELNINSIREGDVKALHYFDKYDVSVPRLERDIRSPDFGKPVMYTVHPTHGSAPFRVHPSRVLRFDGIRPPTKSGFTSYDHNWGESKLIPIMISLLQDQLLATGITHMSQEASIPVLHILGLRQQQASGATHHGQLSDEEIGQQINRTKSIHRLLMLDDKGREEFTRVAIQFGGMADLMDRFSGRVAAAGRIPRTRFLGSPPIGLSATGESDMRNYVLMMEAERAKLLKPRLRFLDQVLTRHIGMSDDVEYEWHSLIEMSDREIAETAKLKAEALHISLLDQVIDEDEMRRALDGDPVFGDLQGDAPEPDIVMPMLNGGPAPAAANGAPKGGKGGKPRPF